MAITEAFTGTESVTTTEWSLTADSSTVQTQTDDGIYQLFLDLSGLQNGDAFRLRGYEKVRSADSQRVFLDYTIAHAQSTPNWVSDSFILMNGWDFTLLRTAGSDRTITWSIRKIA